MDADDFIYVRQGTPLRRSDNKTVCKVIESAKSIRMARGTERQCDSIEPYGLIEVE
jgi:hypothetical protein